MEAEKIKKKYKKKKEIGELNKQNKKATDWKRKRVLMYNYETNKHEILSCKPSTIHDLTSSFAYIALSFSDHRALSETATF